MTYARHVSRKATPQSEPIPGKPQVQNNAGGYSYALDCWGQLERFLILGSAGGTYYVGERKLTKDNAACVEACANQDAVRTVNAICTISESGRAPKNDSAIFALALLASHPTTEVRQLALAALPKVARTATHLFQFIGECKELRGWGRGLRAAIAEWYNAKPVGGLAYQTTKYRNRNGYTHRDALRLCHARPGDDADRQALYRWIVKNECIGVEPGHPLALVSGLRAIEAATSAKDAAKIIRDYDLVMEHVPNTFLDSTEVWDAMLPQLQPTSLIRNLGKMTAIGLLKPLSEGTNRVCKVLTDVAALKRARVHPFSVLLALDTYGNGHGFRGKLTWQPVAAIRGALEEAFYAAFQAVEPSGKRHLLALDVSGSMGWTNIANSQITAAKGAACMAMVTMKTEPQTHLMGFSHQLVPIDISRLSRLDSVIERIGNIPMGGTDCALPMIYAAYEKLEVDTFVVYTDSETWAGKMHPSQALLNYRRQSGINAKLIVVGMTATEFTIADPTDVGMLDVVGFDSSCPSVMADFSR